MSIVKCPPATSMCVPATIRYPLVRHTYPARRAPPDLTRTLSPPQGPRPPPAPQPPHGPDHSSHHAPTSAPFRAVPAALLCALFLFDKCFGIPFALSTKRTFTRTLPPQQARAAGVRLRRLNMQSFHLASRTPPPLCPGPGPCRPLSLHCYAVCPCDTLGLTSAPFRAVPRSTFIGPTPYECSGVPFAFSLPDRPERLVSGSDDFTLCLYTPSTSKTPIARMTGHVQLINQVRGVRGEEDQTMHVRDNRVVRLVVCLKGRVPCCLICGVG